MFISVKRHEREKQELAASTRLNEAIFKHADQAAFLLDGRGRLLPQVSRAAAPMFRRQEFSGLTVEKLLAPMVSAKTLTLIRAHVAALLGGTLDSQSPGLEDVEVRLPNPDGSTQTAHYTFAFDPLEGAEENKAWLVRVSDVTEQVQALRELDDLRTQTRVQGEILRSVLTLGGARFGTFLQKTDAAMKTIGTVLKKSAREEDAFRGKLEETLTEVQRVRREATAFKLSGLEGTAQVFEEALHELRNRTELSGSDFLPLAVKLDQLYGQFALIKSLTMAARAREDLTTLSQSSPNITPAAPLVEPPEAARTPVRRDPATTAPAAGSLDHTLQSLTEHVAEEQNKRVILECSGLDSIPPRYQAAVKNIAIQLIRNAVMHGIETPAERERAGKAPHGTLRVDFKAAHHGHEFHFEDDGAGLDPDRVRATAVARGIVTHEAAERMRDREAIKLIFKSRYTTLGTAADDLTHGTGMSLVRRYVHDTGGKIALASLNGHETRFKITLPAVDYAAADESDSVSQQTQVA